MRTKLIILDFGELGDQQVEVTFESKEKNMIIESLLWGNVDISGCIKEEAWQTIADKLLDEDSDETPIEDDRILN